MKIVGRIVISKAKVNKMRKKMTKEEVAEYHDKTKKSAHKHKSKKDYNRQKNKKVEVY